MKKWTNRVALTASDSPPGQVWQQGFPLNKSYLEVERRGQQSMAQATSVQGLNQSD